MIVGHGIDLQIISQVAKAHAKSSRFAQKVLTEEESKVFESLKGERQISYLAGRWSAKEAFSKAWGTGIGQISFQDLEILSNDLGAPVFTKHPFSGEVWVSISHSGDFVQSSVILEEKDD
ncbi:holo-ACP synthase [Streptococcus moroccensis]|uniref:Holo-[acyl-carrier-protein] synthase n=1 Tax=Streptococcus moroccensis TaxID=1451356 RepID=A0ABT9YRZ3_9STRE|nr:holo-ACP synthase [Streptococcus moroccensis]MDQ0222774.1 holo-[acyl-carrier protein] synthase [Streptococcus moroccensis]